MNAQGHPDDKDLFMFQSGCRALEKARNHLTAAGLAFEETPVGHDLRDCMRKLLGVEKHANRLRQNVEVSTASQLELVEDE